MNLVNEQGAQVPLGVRLGAGGEGDVYAVSDLVAAKALFAKRRTRETHDKIRAMIQRPPPGAHERVEGYPVLTWPQHVVYENAARPDSFAGYTMLRVQVKRDFVPLYQVLSGSRRKALLGQGLTWDRLVLLGLRIAHVVRTLHSMDYAVGDLNDRNILVSRRLTPLFLDTDSFEVPRPIAGRFPCPVGDRLYWPPELLRVDLGSYKGSRVPADEYALAVLLFQLFMNGMRPYQSRGTRVDDLETIEKKTEAGHYPWTNPKAGVLEPPAGAPAYASLPDPIRRAFDDAFLAGHQNPKKRPSADDWHRILKRSHEEGYQTCKVHASHRFGAAARKCPWCADPNDPFTEHARPVLSVRRRVRKQVVAPKPARVRRSKAVPRPKRRPWAPAGSGRPKAPLPAPVRAKPAKRLRPKGTGKRAAWIAGGMFNSGVSAAYYSPVFFFAHASWSLPILVYVALLAALFPGLAAWTILARRPTRSFLGTALAAGISLSVALWAWFGWVAVAVLAGFTHLWLGWLLYRFLERRRHEKFRPDAPGIRHAGLGLVAAYLPLCVLLWTVG